MHYATGYPNKILKYNNTFLSVYYEPIPGNGIALQGVFAYVSYHGDGIWADVIDMFGRDELSKINELVYNALNP